jgi:PAS domain S-box-containing protein
VDHEREDDRLWERDRALLQGLLDAIPDLVFYKNLQFRYLGCNAAFLRYAGVTREELLGRDDYDLFTPDDATWYRSIDRRVVETGEPAAVEEWVPFPDGTRALYETVKSLVRDAEGRPLCLIGVSRDITVRKEGEEATQRLNETLEQRVQERTAQLTQTIADLENEILERIHVESGLRLAQQQQRALLDSIADLAWLKDAGGRIVAVNRPMATAAGMTPEEMVGRTVFDLFPPETAERYDRDDREVLALRRPKRVVENLVGREGREGWYETIKTPIFDERGEVVGTAGVAREVTGRGDAEDLHRQFAEQLEGLVRERTAHLERANAALIEEIRARRKP